VLQENAISRAKEFLRKLDAIEVLQSLPDGITLANAEGRIEFSNQAADKMLGVGAATEESPEGWSGYYGVFLADGETVFPTDRYPLVRALAGEETREVEMVVRNASVPDGAILSVSGRPLVSANGEILGAAVAFRDVTELRQTQRRLEEAIARLELVQALRAELSTFIVHDLKNPLASILGTCELLASQSLEGQAADDVAVIREAARRMHRMVLDILDLQMSEDGALELDLVDVEAGQLLEQLLAAAKPRLAARDQTITISKSAGTLQVDESLFFRVLMNIVDNCAKYGPAGGSVHVEATHSDGRVCISVQDEGPGVPEHLRERIFEKYTRAERADEMRSRDSRGLGLRFCRMVVDAHGGRIWVEDGVPKGSRFCVELQSRNG